MKIELKKIGIIDHAEIDITHNLIILCGPNNTGKTYAANAIYSIFKYYREENLYIDNEITKQLKAVLTDGKSRVLLKSELVDSLIKKNIKNIIRYLPNVFATTTNFFSKASIDIHISDIEITDKINSLSLKFGLKFGNSVVQIEKKEGEQFVDLFLTEETTEVKNSNDMSGFIFEIVGSRIKDQIFDHIFNNTYITPAERTAINIFSKELSVKRNEIVDKLLEYKGTKTSNSPLKEAQRYPLPIRDSLDIAEDLSNLQKNTSSYSFLADQIENEILKGKISVSKSGDVLFSPAKTKIKNLNIHMSASIVKSLSNLVFYFRHLAKQNDFIIIDEPELNLHPDNQIIMARLIARIVNSGFKILISTHSDYVLKEINNLIRLNFGGVNSEFLMNKYNYTKQDLLDKDKVGVYLFKDKNVENIPVDEYGFEISTIEKENSKLAEISESIYYQLFDKDE